MINIKRKRWIITNNKGEVFIRGANSHYFVNQSSIEIIFLLTFENKNDAIKYFNKTNSFPYDGETYKAIEVTGIITDCNTHEEEN